MSNKTQKTKPPGTPGRPHLPDAERKDHIWRICFTPKEHKLIRRAAMRPLKGDPAESVSSWAAGVLLRAARGRL